MCDVLIFIFCFPGSVFVEKDVRIGPYWLSPFVFIIIIVVVITILESLCCRLCFRLHIPMLCCPLLVVWMRIALGGVAARS